jgi:hypothetical protein
MSTATRAIMRYQHGQWFDIRHLRTCSTMFTRDSGAILGDSGWPWLRQNPIQDTHTRHVHSTRTQLPPKQESQIPPPMHRHLHSTRTLRRALGWLKHGGRSNASGSPLFEEDLKYTTQHVETVYISPDSAEVTNSYHIVSLDIIDDNLPFIPPEEVKKRNSAKSGGMCMFHISI